MNNYQKDSENPTKNQEDKQNVKKPKQNEKKKESLKPTNEVKIYFSLNLKILSNKLPILKKIL